MPSSSSLPTLGDIKAGLRNLLEPRITDLKKLDDWLASLLSEVYGQVLCVNLFIDLSKRCLDASLVASVIDQMAFAGAQGRWAFYRYVEDHQSDTLCNHLHGPVTLDTDQYARVLPIMDMIEYYLRKPLMLPPLTYEAEQEVLERFFTLPPDKRETLGVVTEVWRGRMLNVWITSKSLLDTSLAGLSENETANVLRDRLGFSGLDSGKLVGIVYPRRFDRVETYVPTSLDSHSGSLFYVSTDGSDRWGLTCGLEASIEGLRERVHQAFDGGLTDQFAMKLFGEITKPAAPDPTHLLNEALTRAS